MTIKKFEIIKKLSSDDSGPAHGIVRFYNGHIDAAKLDKQKFFRRQAVTIRNMNNKEFVIRYAMGSAGMKLDRKSLAIDYDGVDALGLTYGKPCDIQVRQATSLEIYRWYWTHSELPIQLSVRLGVAGCILGVAGFVLGMISFV